MHFKAFSAFPAFPERHGRERGREGEPGSQRGMLGRVVQALLEVNVTEKGPGFVRARLKSGGKHCCSGKLRWGFRLIAGESAEAVDGGPHTHAASHWAASRAQPYGDELFAGSTGAEEGSLWGKHPLFPRQSPVPGSFSTPRQDRLHPMSPGSSAASRDLAGGAGSRSHRGWDKVPLDRGKCFWKHGKV